ncbi:LytTR family DNA-binding domain-containing protein [Alkaliphilus oremlandii]|uniref:Response regulator receiver protein n=1 Tax=Alkaliphilus oremlandii (strain OhILAs) TaxID=350688 RepID=A8MKN1_ALKOO|nr:response regulator receiver protein [Alkaliphilus oremlandii OhILAs]
MDLIKKNSNLDEFLILSLRNRQEIININSINFIQKVNDRHVVISTLTAEYTIQSTLKNIWNILENKNIFFRSHKSFIINLKQIKSINRFSNSYCVNFKRTEKRAILSRDNKKKLQDLIISI